MSDDAPGTVCLGDCTACITVWDGTELPAPHVPGDITSSEATIRTTVPFLVRDIRASLLPGSGAHACVCVCVCVCVYTCAVCVVCVVSACACARAPGGALVPPLGHFLPLGVTRSSTTPRERSRQRREPDGPQP